MNIIFVVAYYAFKRGQGLREEQGFGNYFIQMEDEPSWGDWGDFIAKVTSEVKTKINFDGDIKVVILNYKKLRTVPPRKDFPS